MKKRKAIKCYQEKCSLRFRVPAEVHFGPKITRNKCKDSLIQVKSPEKAHKLFFFSYTSSDGIARMEKNENTNLESQ